MRRILSLGLLFIFGLSTLVPFSIGFNVEKSFFVNDSINFSVYNIPENVMVNESGDCWINQSKMITVEVYSEPGNYPMNASILISGCGLNISIEERYAIDEGFWIEDGVYKIDLSPKQSGTITITVINMSYNLNASKDFSIKGLTGYAWTSEGKDKVIIFGRTEKIIFMINYGQYAHVHLTWVNKFWTDAVFINQTNGDNTQGNGMNGEFWFIIDEDDFIDSSGLIIIVGKAGGYYLWDLIEVLEPIHIPPPEIEGPNTGKPDISYEFSFVTNISEDVEVSYYIDWGDGEVTNWTQLLESGIPYVENHTWMTQGIYTLRAKARDGYNTESNWTEFKIKIPRTTTYQWYHWIFERFPLLERLLYLL